MVKQGPKLKGGRYNVDGEEGRWNEATRALRGENISSLQDFKKAYSEDTYFPNGIDKFVNLVKDKSYWEEATIGQPLNKGDRFFDENGDGNQTLAGYCDISDPNTENELAPNTQIYISNPDGSFWVRKDLISPFLAVDKNNAIESIKAYKKKWMMGEMVSRHCPCIKQPDGERNKLIDCILNNTPYTASEALSREGGARRRRKTYKKRKSRKSRRKRKSKKTKRRRRRRRK